MEEWRRTAPVTGRLTHSRVDLLFSNECRERVRLTDPYRDVVRAVRCFEAMGLRPVRLDADDWVTLADIADRVGRSRETVRLWSTGRLGRGDFPAPLNPGRDTTFFSWVEVAAWLYAGQPGSTGARDEPVLAALNLALQLRRLLPWLSRPRSVLALAFPIAEAGSGHDSFGRRRAGSGRMG